MRGPVSPVGPEGEQGVQGTRSDRGRIGTKGDQGVRGSACPVGSKGVQGVQRAKGDRGERGQRGVKGEKGIRGDNSNVLSVLSEYLPIRLATRYGEKSGLSSGMYQRVGRVSQNCLDVWERYVMLAGTMNPRGILMLNLSMAKDMKWQTYRKRLVMVIL